MQVEGLSLNAGSSTLNQNALVRDSTSPQLLVGNVSFVPFDITNAAPLIGKAIDGCNVPVRYCTDLEDAEPTRMLAIDTIDAFDPEPDAEVTQHAATTSSGDVS